MFLSGDHTEQAPQLAALLEGYQEFRQFDARELHLIEALRSLRIMHYAAWLARRWRDPAFQAAFPWFASRRYRSYARTAPDHEVFELPVLALDEI